MAHTQGKWTVRYAENLTAITTPTGEFQISLFSSQLNPALSCSIQEWESNVNLIAAAPELLEACKWAARGEHHSACASLKGHKCNCYVGACLDIIAKTESS